MIRRSAQRLVLLSAVALLVGAVLYVRGQMQGAPGGPPFGGPPGGPPPGPQSGPAGGAPGPQPGKGADPVAGGQTTPAQRPEVRVVQIEPGSYQAQVAGYGEARARYALSLTAQVAGRVVALADNLQSGLRVGKGEVLLELEDTDYRAAVASAENDLAAAKLALLEEERQGIQARAEWKASGLKGKPDSALVLREPHLAAAKAAVANAEAALASARHDLAETRIRAPFDAMVVSRSVAPGSYVQAGTEVATLYSADRIEISVPLPEQDWEKLPTAAELKQATWPVVLRSVDSGQRWDGYVLRAEQHLDETTRQRALIVAVDRPLDRSPPLLPGTFLHATVAGRHLDGLLKLPSSALSLRGEIWAIGANDTLRSFPAEAVFADGEGLYVDAPEATSAPLEVVVHPLNGYLQGMAVKPVAAVGGD